MPVADKVYVGTFARKVFACTTEVASGKSANLEARRARYTLLSPPLPSFPSTERSKSGGTRHGTFAEGEGREKLYDCCRGVFGGA